MIVRDGGHQQLGDEKRLHISEGISLILKMGRGEQGVYSRSTF